MIGALKMVAFDAPDHRVLAEFYGDLLAGEQTYADGDWVTVLTPDGWQLGFQHAPDLVPPRWPDADAPQQMHIDLRVPDRNAATRRAESLGATVVGGGERWTDPDYPQQVHLCVHVTDIDDAESKALAIGATRLPGRGDSWRVFADSSGHPFCLTW